MPRSGPFEPSRLAAGPWWGLPLMLMLSACTWPVGAEARVSPPPAAAEAATGDFAPARAALEQAAAAPNGLWPGFSLRDWPIVLHRPGGAAALFFGPEPPPSPFEAAAPGMALARQAAFPRGITLGWKLGDREAVTVEVETSLAQAALIGVHEAFHAYQRTRAFPPGPTTDMPLGDGRAFGLADTERGLLAQALRDERPIERLRDFWAVRQTRRQALRADQIGHEDALEAIEGTAYYLEGRMGAAAAGLGGPFRKREAFVSGLAGALEAPLGVQDFPRGRLLQGGAALALLLEDRLPGWQARVERGDTLSALLGEIIGPIDVASRYAAVAARVDVAGNIRSASERLGRLERERDEALARFKALPGLTVRLSVPVARGGYSTTHATKWELADGGTLFAAGSVLSMASEGLALDVSGMFTVQRDGDRWVFVFHAPAEAVRISGEPRGTVSIAAGGTRLTTGPANVRRSGQTLTLEL